jgi:hypothetical protein
MSAVLEFENSQHPLVDRRTEIARWAQRAVVKVTISGRVSARAQTLAEAGFGALDAAHVACADAAGYDCLLTCDARLIRVARCVQLAMHVQNPIEYVEEETDCAQRSPSACEPRIRRHGRPDGLEAPAVAAPERHEDAKGENLRLPPAPAVFPTLGFKLAAFPVVFTVNCRAKITNGNSRSAQGIK